MDQWCIPDTSSNMSAATTHFSFGDDSEEFNRAMGDLDTTKTLIICSAFIAMIFGFLYLYFVSCLGTFLVWITIFLTFIGGGFLGVVLIGKVCYFFFFFFFCVCFVVALAFLWAYVLYACFVYVSDKCMTTQCKIYDMFVFFFCFVFAMAVIYFYFSTAKRVSTTKQ